MSSEQKNDELSFFGWIVAAGSFALVVSLLYFGQLVSTAWHFAHLYKDVSQQLESNAEVSKILEQEKYASLINKGDDDLQNLLAIVELTKKNRFDEARAYAGKIKSGLGTSGLALETKLTLASSGISRGEELSSTKVALERKRAQAARDFQALRIKFAKELGLDGSVGGEDDGEFARYSSGMFASFPVIDGLPDGLAKVSDLAPHLPRDKRRSIVRSFKISRSTLQEKMQQMRDESEILSLAIDEVESKYKNVNVELSSLTGDQGSNKEEVLAIARILVKEKLTPRLDENVGKAYRMFRTYSASLFDEPLPELYSKPA